MATLGRFFRLILQKSHADSKCMTHPLLKKPQLFHLSGRLAPVGPPLDLTTKLFYLPAKPQRVKLTTTSGKTGFIPALIRQPVTMPATEVPAPRGQIELRHPPATIHAISADGKHWLRVHNWMDICLAGSSTRGASLRRSGRKQADGQPIERLCREGRQPN